MTEFLTKLLAVEAPEKMHLESAEVAFRAPMAWWLAAMIIVAMVVGVLFLYALERGTLGWVRRSLLILIRTSLLVLILLLIFRPVLLSEFKGTRTRHIVVLLDSSLSMKQKDRRVSDEDIVRVAIAKGFVPLTTRVDKVEQSVVQQLKSRADLVKDPARVDMVKWMLTNKDLKLVDKLETKGKLQAWAFGSRLMGLSNDADPLPKEVLARLTPLANSKKEFDSRDQFVEELDRVFRDDKESLKTYQERIIDRASGAKYKLTEESLKLLGGADKKNVNEQLLANLNPSDDRTFLYDSVNSILQRKDGDLPAAIFIITDGQDNASNLKRSDITSLCKNYQVPLYIYGVGSAQAASLQLKEVTLPADTLFVKDTVAIPVAWKSKGIKDGTVEITLHMKKKIPGTDKWGEYEIVKVKDRDKDVDKRKHKVKEGLDLRDALVFPVQERPGLKPGEEQDEIQKLKVTLELTGNKLYEDDKGKPIFSESVEREVRVTNRKIKVLVIENSPRFEFKFLQGALDPDRERRFETTYYLGSADEKVTRPTIKATPEEMRKRPFIRFLPKTREEFFDSKFDVIVLGDIAPEPDPDKKTPGLGKQQMEWIKEFVQKFRGGLIVVAGRQNMPVKYKDEGLSDKDPKKNPLAELLPIEFEGKKLGLEERPQEYMPMLTDAGQRTDMLFLADTPEENLKIWEKELPSGFNWQFPITKLRPGATALVVNPRAKLPGTEQSMPLIATMMSGRGQVLFCGTDETWRWRKDVGDKYFVRYWGQILYQMGLPHLLGEGSKRVVFSQEQSEFTLGKQSYLYLRAYDKEFNPRKDPQIDAMLEQVDGDKSGRIAPRPVVFRQVNDLNGKPVEGVYKVPLPNQEDGKFQIKLTNLGEPYSFTYRVETPPRHEKDELGLAEKELRDLARDSGGKFYREEDLSRLADDVKERKVDFHIRQEVVLWNPLVMLLFIGLISAEWLIRKFSNLS